MKLSDKIESNGFGQNSKTQAQSQQAATGSSFPAGQEHALAFADAAQGNLAVQLQRKADFLKGLNGMIDSAVEAIVQVEEDILSGNALERKLAERRSQYAFGCVEDIKASVSFDQLTTLEAMAKPVEFPSVDAAIKAISPAGKARLDQAVLSPGK